MWTESMFNRSSLSCIFMKKKTYNLVWMFFFYCFTLNGFKDGENFLKPFNWINWLQRWSIEIMIEWNLGACYKIDASSVFLLNWVAVRFFSFSLLFHFDSHQANGKFLYCVAPAACYCFDTNYTKRKEENRLNQWISFKNFAPITTSRQTIGEMSLRMMFN